MWVLYIVNTYHKCFIVVLHCFSRDLIGVSTVVSYCFEMIQSFLACFLDVSRLFIVVSSVLYLLFRGILMSFKESFKGIWLSV